MKTKISITVCCLVVLTICQTAIAQRSAEGYVKKSQERLKDRDLDGAISELDKAISLKPDFAEAYVQRSRLYMMRGELLPALADLDKALLINPEMTQAYADRGRVRLFTNNSNGALSDFDNAIARGHRSDEVYGFRAQLKLMSDDAAGALSDYNVAISMNPRRINYYLGRAAARSRAGDEAGALADYTSVIDAFEEREGRRSQKGKPASKAAAPDIVSPIIKGEERTSTKASPAPDRADKTVTVTTRIEAVASINVEEESTMTAEQMEYLPNVAGAYLNRGQYYGNKGDTDAALADLNKSIEIDPHEFLAYSVRGEVRRKRGELEASLTDLNKSIDLQPGNLLTYIERGATLLLMDRDAEAEKDFSKVLTESPAYKTMVEERRAEMKAQRAKTQ